MNERFKVLRKIGEGSFGEVLLAEDLQHSKQLVAIKTLSVSGNDETKPISNSILREIDSLISAQKHPNIISIETVLPSPLSSSILGIWIVFEYMEFNLNNIISTDKMIPIPQIKFIIRSILRGLEYLHSLSIIHRDIKPQNILISSDGFKVVLADFGLSRSLPKTNESKDPTAEKQRNRLTNGVETRWYRAPELLLGATEYGTEIDVWSCGLILIELLQSKPFLPGIGDIDQLCKTVRILGDLSESNWVGVSKLPDFGKISFTNVNNQPATPNITNFLSSDINSDPNVTELIAGLVSYPDKRWNASKSLSSKWFFTFPFPSSRITILPHNH